MSEPNPDAAPCRRFVDPAYRPMCATLAEVRAGIDVLDTQLVEPFNGWKKGTRFLLANGQTWQALEGEYWSPLKPAGIKASIVPGVLGSFFLEIEGVGPRIRVSLVSP